MLRWAGRIVAFGSLAVACLAIFFYIRSKFRADVITIITPGHHCVVIACVDDELEITEVSPWPGPRRFQWSTGATHFYVDLNSDGVPDKLVGPELPGSGWPTIPATCLEWRNFSTAHEQTSLVYSDGEQLPVDVPWRDLHLGGFDSGFSPSHSADLYRASSPAWAVALAFTFPGLICLATTARARLRRRTRQRKGLCIACGYDLRESPARCPECGFAGNVLVET